MKTLRCVSALGTAALVLGVAAGCSPGGNQNVASRTPTAAATSPSASSSASPSSPASPQPVAGAYGVLVMAPQANYSVSLVATNGKVVATATTSGFPQALCGGQLAAAVPLPVSTSDTRVYFLDGQGVVEFLTPDGQKGQATTVPTPTASRRAMFAVSPDDRRIAVVVDDFTASGASTRLYVEDLNGGGNHVDLFSETGSNTLWPIGWHGANNLVVAKVAACTAGGGPFCCGPLELHVVDPTTANRRFTLGGGGCVVVGPPSPGGVVCEDTGFTEAHEVNWVGYWFDSFNVPGASAAMISPNGKLVAVTYTDRMIMRPGSVNVSMLACGWIDDSHLLAGGDAQHQPRVGNALTGDIVPVPAQGDCGGRLPGGL